MKKQVLWTKDLEVLKDEQHCPEFIARTGTIEDRMGSIFFGSLTAGQFLGLGLTLLSYC
jgi:hypothetical protein